MKKILLLVTLIPALGWSQTFICPMKENGAIHLKISGQESITADIFQDKKLVTSCLFNARFPPSDGRGVSDFIMQDFEKVSCSKMETKFVKTYRISDHVYTKISLDKQKAVFFILKNHHPFDCKPAK